MKGLHEWKAGTLTLRDLHHQTVGGTRECQRSKTNCRGNKTNTGRIMQKSAEAIVGISLKAEGLNVKTGSLTVRSLSEASEHRK